MSTPDLIKNDPPPPRENDLFRTGETAVQVRDAAAINTNTEFKSPPGRTRG